VIQKTHYKFWRQVAHTLIKESIVKNTTCLEKVVYSAIETTCFGLYWPSSGFYSIKEESIKAVKNCEVVLIKRSLRQSPGPSVPSAKLFVNMEKFTRDLKIVSALLYFHGKR